MRRLLVLAFLAACLTAALLPHAALASVGTDWTAGTYASSDFWCVSASDASHAFCAGEEGVVASTSDGGATWSTRAITGVSLGALACSGPSDVWAAGGEGTILHSADGGSTWTTQTTPTTAYLYGLSFPGPSDGWAVGSGDGVSVVIHTSDGGLTWTPQDPGTGEVLTGVCFVDAHQGWATGWNGTLLHTIDGGVTWTPQSAGTLEDLTAVVFTDALDGWVVGDGGTILRTVDGGADWSRQAPGSFTRFSSVAAVASDTVWALGWDGTIAHTTDAGVSWSIEPAGTTADLNGAAFSGRAGWAAGVNGTIVAAGDHLPPVTQATGPVSGWVRGAVSVTLRAADSGFGVAWTDVAVGPSHAATYAGPIVVSDEGATTVSFSSVDRAGNAEATKSVDVHIDDTPPTVSCDAAGTYISFAEIHLTAVDVLSGVAGVFWQADGGTVQSGRTVLVSGVGPHTVTYWATDNAGNVAGAQSATVRRDRARP